MFDKKKAVQKEFEKLRTYREQAIKIIQDGQNHLENVNANIKELIELEIVSGSKDIILCGPTPKREKLEVILLNTFCDKSPAGICVIEASTSNRFCIYCQKGE